MFNLVLPKKATVCCGFILALFASLEVNATGPDNAGVRSLSVFASNGTQSTSIYANGTMQAEINIMYELESGYSFEQARLKVANTGGNLDGWIVSQVDNGYEHDLPANSTVAYKEKVLGNSKVLYLSTYTAKAVLVCAEITVKKNDSGSETVVSTCSNQSQNAAVSVNAIPPAYLTSSDFELTSWDESREIIGTIVDDRAVGEIREQVLKAIRPINPIHSFDTEYYLENFQIFPPGGPSYFQSPFLDVTESILSEYHWSPQMPWDVGHIMSFVAHPDRVQKIKFIENSGKDKHTGKTLEVTIPYAHASDAMYVLSFITYKLRDDKFVYDTLHHDHVLCDESLDNGKLKCQTPSTLNETAPYRLFDKSDATDISRQEGIIRLKDIYGTESSLYFGIKGEWVNNTQDYVIYLK
ncbi:TPA: hypothetical protein PMD70_003448 [Vibrio cholerae]|nr:hypothetical protein [Vibrio cholerae]